MQRLIVLAVGFAIAAAVSGCGFQDFVHNETLVARYRMVAVDIDEDMMLCWSLDGGNCAGILPGPTLFAAGFNDRYVVAAVHPSSFGHPVSKAVTQYFYVIRDPQNEDKDLGEPRNGIKGPFTKPEFEAEVERLGLPPFTRVFKHLE